MPPEVFLDTAFALVFANPNDLLQRRATLLADQVEATRTRLITTCAALLEGNAFVKLRYHAASVQLRDNHQACGDVWQSAPS